MNKGLWVGLIAVLLAAGCRGGGEEVDFQGEPQPPDPSPAIAANDARMPTAEDPQVAGVEGVLLVEGFTVLDPSETEPPGSGTSAVVGQVPDMRMLVRLVDPEDDILNETFPDVGGRFLLEYSGPVINAKLQVEFTVAEDLDGDGEGGDTLLHSVPVGLKPGRVAQVNLTLARRTAVVGVGQPFPGVADLELYPEAGELLIVFYVGQDGNGSHNEFYGVNYAEGQTVFDTDGDQFLETGDDIVGEDEDVNGWIDSYEESFGVDAESQFMFGVVTNVNKASQTLTLATVDAGALLVLVDPFTSIEPFSPDNQFYGGLPLDASLIGSQVQILGKATPDGFLALWIVVLPDDPPAPGGV